MISKLTLPHRHIFDLGTPTLFHLAKPYHRASLWCWMHPCDLTNILAFETAFSFPAASSERPLACSRVHLQAKVAEQYAQRTGSEYWQDGPRLACPILWNDIACPMLTYIHYYINLICVKTFINMSASAALHAKHAAPGAEHGLARQRRRRRRRRRRRKSINGSEPRQYDHLK